MNKNKLIAMMVVPAVIAPSVVQAQSTMNYDMDEKEINNYSSDTRYKETQLEQGAGTTAAYNWQEKEDEFVDGFRYKTLEPNSTSPDRTKWGIEIEFDKEKSQRTYTDFIFSNSGLLGNYLNAGNISANDVGVNLSKKDNFKDSTYKPQANLDITSSVRQRNLNLYSTKEDLKHINSIENKNTVMNWQGKYTQEVTTTSGPRATQSSSSFFSFSVNPWPNENDKLSPLKLNGTHDKKEYVKGQDIKTEIKIDNLDENAKERIAGQVYNPVTGKLIKEADVYLDEDGFIHVKLPKGVVNEDGTENKDSIFNQNDYKALQNLDVKIFARPRTKAEFEKIVNDRAEELGDDAGFYTPTGAGTKTIDHNGKDVEVDLQGIDRYDHYNLIGSFKIQLDDTRYYDQGFIDSNKDDISKNISSKVKSGEPLSIDLYQPEDKKDNEYQRDADFMKKLVEDKNAFAKIDLSFVEKENEGKAEKDKWKVEYDKALTKITVTPPKSAKAGDFMAIPITYTYTNGSTDNHWFHFVVQETDNNKPEYFAKVGLRGSTLTNKPSLPDDEISLKKRQPVSYELLDTNTYKDNKGNTWANPKIDEKTGEVTIDVPKENIEGGENIFVDVKVNYLDENGEPHYEIIKAQFVAKAKYEGTFTYEEEQKIAFETKVELDDSLPVGEQKITQEGKPGTKSRTITQKYENGKLLDQEVGNFTIKEEPVEQIIKVGSKTEGTHEHIEETPFKYTVIEDENLKKGEWKEEVKGAKGSRTTKWTIINSKIVGEPQTTITEPVDAVIRVGKGTLNGEHTTEEEQTIANKTKIEFDDSLPAGEQQVVQEGKQGKQTRKVTLTLEDGKVTNTEYGDYETIEEPEDRIIKVGSKTEGTHEHTEELPFQTKVVYNKDLKKGEWKYKQEGQLGQLKTTWTIENSKIVGEPITERKEPVDAIIEVGSQDFTGVVENKEETETSFTVKVVENKELPAGQSKIKQEGKPGKTIFEYKQAIKNGQADGEPEKKETVVEKPVEHIIEVGTKPAENNKEYAKDVNVVIEYVFDDTKEKGYFETGELIKGKVETKIVNRYNPETGEIETTEEELVTEAKQKVIIGTKDYTGSYEYECNDTLPFDVEVREDPNLPKGEKKIIQEGKPGNKYFKYKQELKNGQPVGDPEKVEEKITEEPVNEIVVVGTGKLDGETTSTVEREIPYETKIIYDENLEVGNTVVEKEGIVGKEKVTITQKVEDGKPVGEPKETVEKIKDKEDRVVRIGIKPVVIENETPFETEYIYNPELGPDEQVEKQEGKTGKLITKINFNKDTGMIETSQEEIESVKRIVEYGSKTSGKVTLTKELPFEVEIVEDPTMEVGKQETVQEGELGESQVTVTIENGKEVNREEEITRKPKKKIIKIGTKCKCDDITPDKPEDDKSDKNDDKPSDENNKPNKPKEDEKPNKPSEENDKSEDDKPNKPKDNKTDKDDDKPSNSNKDDDKPSDSNKPKDISTDNEKPSVEKTKNKDDNKPKKVTSKNESSDDKVKTGITGTLGIGATLIAALTAYKVSKKK